MNNIVQALSNLLIVKATLRSSPNNTVDNSM
jgi:hypothetical protein